MAYHEIYEKLGQRQKVIYLTIRDYPHRTDREITQILGFSDPNMVRPRRKELIDKELILSSGIVTCHITGKKAHIWEVMRG